MTDIFISYKREDLDSLQPLVAALKAEPLSVWWDQDIPGGHLWRQTIEAKLDQARCVIVAWSPASVAPEASFVHEEAFRALKQGKLLPIRIAPVEPPLGFGEVQTLDLIGWKGNRDDLRFQDILAAARSLLEGKPRPRPAWPRRRALRRRLAWASTIPTALLAYYTFTLTRDPACHTEHEQAWQTTTKALPLTVRSSLSAHPTKPQAQADTLGRVPAEAARVCQPFTQGPFRLRASSATLTEWRCSQREPGWFCAYEGEALCQIQQRQTIEHEVCDP